MKGRAAAETVVMVTQDGATVTGLLYGQGSSVVIAQHPREFIASHYMTPHILDAGFAIFVQSPRSIGNDVRLEHEQSLYEVAAGIREMRKRGFRQVFLLGNSGGASLYGYYIEQAHSDGVDRVDLSPTGRPTGFAKADFPGVDGLILLSPHPGQGLLLLSSLDASVVDESDPFAVDGALDPFAASNGFATAAKGGASYSDDFVKQYRLGQIRRAESLDKWAREAIAWKREGREAAKATPSFAAMRQAAHSPIMTLWRTDADLRSFDLSLDPSQRGFGSLWGPNPAASNFGVLGFGRQVTPESWLSTWSGLSSLANLPRTAPKIDIPTLLIAYTADNSVFPSETEAIFDALGSSDKVHLNFLGNHHGWVANGSERSRRGQVEAGQAIGTWLSEREGSF